MAIVDPLTRLEGVILRLARGDADDIWLAEGLVTWLTSTAPLETSLGCAPGARQARRQRGRDAALHQLAQRLPAHSARALAALMHAVVARYRPRWQRDKAAGYRPDGIPGLAFDILMHGGLPGEERLRKLMGYERNGDNPPGLADCASKSKSEGTVNGA